MSRRGDETMQATQQQAALPDFPVGLALGNADLSPSGMAVYLRRVSGSAAYCFARTMHEDAAWANESWGAYWADVMRLV